MARSIWKKKEVHPVVGNREKGRKRKIGDAVELPLVDTLHVKPNSQESSGANDIGDDVEDCCSSGQGVKVDEGVRQYSVCRPSSWQRKKQRKAKLLEPYNAEFQSKVRIENLLREKEVNQLNAHLSSAVARPKSKSKAASVSTSNPGLSRQHPKGWTPASEILIPRFAMFYSKILGQKPGLPAIHILNKLSDSKIAARKLYREIFIQSPQAGNDARNKGKHSGKFQKLLNPRFIPRKYEKLLFLLSKVLHKSRTCPFSQLLEHHCPLPIHMTRSGGITPPGSSTSTRSPPYQSLIGCHVDHCKVTSFVWSVCQKIFPKDLLGGKENRNILHNNVNAIVSMRRYETLSLNHVLECWKTGTISWLNIKKNSKQPVLESEHAAKIRVLQRLVYWVLSEFVVPLIRANFYVTESQAHRLHIFYYRKPVWRHIQQLAIRETTHSIYQRVSKCEAANILRHRRIGFSTLRLIPKLSGIRMVANFSTSSVGTFRNERGSRGTRKRGVPFTLQFAPINHVMHGLFLALKQECRTNPMLLGCSVFGYNDAYSRLQPYLRRLKATRNQSQAPFAFIVSADISQAFDTIDVDRLISIVSPLLSKDEYRFVQVSCLSTGNGRPTIAQKVLPDIPENEGELQSMLGEIGGRRNGLVFSNVSHHSIITKQNATKHLQDAVLKSLLRIGKSYYRQKIGIAQGMIISALLCSLYYAELERVHLFPLLKSENKMDELLHYMEKEKDPDKKVEETEDFLLLRLIDDVLFISPDRSIAERFLKRLEHGFPDFGVRINAGKTTHNFCRTSLRSHGYVDGMGVHFIPWCGLLINSANMEIQADYTRYRKDGIASTLTISLTKNPGKMLVTKLCSYMRPKCHAILFDRAINSPRTIRLNIYQLFILGAMKFHCHVTRLPKSPKKCISMLMEAILTAIRYTYSLMNCHMENSSVSHDKKVNVTFSHVEWLGLKAFFQTLGRKPHQYSLMLKELKKMLSTRAYRHIAKQLQDVVDNRRSSVFNQVEF